VTADRTGSLIKGRIGESWADASRRAYREMAGTEVDVDVDVVVVVVVAVAVLVYYDPPTNIETGRRSRSSRDVSVCRTRGVRSRSDSTGQ
jgi:hypothetical protein